MAGKEILKKLNKIQVELSVPKNKEVRSKHGSILYKYRNMESILEELKKYIKENNCTLTGNDDVVDVGGRVYVKATYTITDIDTGESVSATAFAREPLANGNMSDSQVTGSASSYAGKYALGKLFAIDDTIDVDRLGSDLSEEDEREKVKQSLIDEGLRQGIKTSELVKRFNLSTDTTVGELKNYYNELRGK